MDVGACLSRLGVEGGWVANGQSIVYWEADTPQPTQQELLAAWTLIQAERPMKELRAKRDELLSSSDKYALPDWPHADGQRQLWLDYRQALRDLPEQADPTFPTPP